MNSRGVDRLPSILRTAGAACARARSPESPPGIANTDPESSRPGTAYEADLRAMHHGWRPNCYAAGFPTPRDLCLTANDPYRTVDRWQSRHSRAPNDRRSAAGARAPGRTRPTGTRVPVGCNGMLGGAPGALLKWPRGEAPARHCSPVHPIRLTEL